jgi:hypothetical protein
MLTQEQIDKGLSIKELDDHMVALLDPKGYPIAYFSTSGATQETIRETADNYIKNQLQGYE